MEQETRIPGVTFWLIEATEGQSKVHKARAHVVLAADIEDFELWDDVKAKLNGLRIYTVEDFKGQMAALLRSEVSKLEEKVELTQQEKHSTEEQLRHQLDLERARAHNLEIEIRLKQAQLNADKEELGELRAMKASLEDLA